ncbi:MAG TPA: energy transducer TonB [Terracidiphilus sp.]|jgi:TonB family protein
MNNLFNNAVSVRSWLIGRRLVLAAALALTLAVPAGAEDRAVKQRVSPSYPEIAKRMRIEGVVKLSVTVDAEGKVTDVKTVAGNHMLSIAAEDAVRKWKFESGTGSATVDVSMSFALQ